MRWYRSLFFSYYSWYKNWNGADSSPAAWASVILLSLHWLNAITAAYFVLWRRGTGLGHLYGTFRSYWFVPFAIFFVYAWYFVSNVNRLEREFEDEDIGYRIRIGKVGLIYAVSSIAAFLLAAFV